MKNMILAALFMTIGTGGAFAADQSWTGTISDSMCGTKHTMTEHGKNMSDRDCTQMCAGHGAQYVLLSDGKVYKLTNHDSDLKTHAGHVVTLLGDLKGDTIRVSKIEMSKSSND